MNSYFLGGAIVVVVILLSGCGRSCTAPESTETGVLAAKDERIGSRLRPAADSETDVDGSFPKAVNRPLTVVEMDVMEAVFREELPPSVKGGTVCFLSIGIDEQSEKWVDAPTELIRRLKNMNLDLRPASQASIPINDDRLDTRELIVTDPRTKKPAAVFAVSVTKWIDASSARVDVEVYHAPHAAHGFSAIVRKEDGRWRIERTFNFWLTLAKTNTKWQAA